MEQRTDKAMAWFVPGIVLAALITGIVTFVLHGSVNAAITRAVTVLVISCPCALGVAIPLGRVAGIVLAGQMGLLVRDFGAFQKAARIDTVVFDKTGTLTEGRWSLQRIVVFPPFAESLLLSLACALESGCDHPVAVGIREAAARKSVQPAEIVDRQVHENGVSAKWGSRKLRIGSRRFALGTVADDSRVAASPADPSDSGNIESTVFMTVDGACAGEFRFGDMPRPESADTVKALGEMGYDIHLVSGDSRAATQSLARHVGIGTAHGELLPPQKADYIESLQSSGKTVAMIGDGINDAPAMVRSDLAVAMFGGKQLGKEAADVTLMSKNPGQVLTFLELSERVNRKIRQNLLFTFAYNLCAIPVAMAGLLSPLVAVCAMLLSSLSVIFNTVLLLKRPDRKNRDACRSYCARSEASKRLTSKL
jgi:heavy metal translocating P-type ATPase